ncbi:acyltransferase family protein [Acidocella sp.]|jgi:peptidoglycan/LPS O-acetylase OafA/YrhL|uniref:acyltransferase family protein n=1 Tax=Acidocella sp. TaxID=50710 RepID=UPI002F42F5F7
MGLIRLFLALVVVVDHLRILVVSGTAASPDHWIAPAELGLNAGYAVMYFYMVSGFLISYALSHKYADGLWAFYKSRFVRIFSLYWPLYVICLFPVGAIGAIGFWPRLSSIFLFGIDWILAFGTYPNQDGAPFSAYLAQAWSLGAEVTFYVLAPLLVRSIAGSVLLLTFSLATRLSFVHVFGFSLTWTYHFFPATVWFFLLGHLARVVWEKWRLPNWLGVPLLLGSIGVSVHGIPVSAWDNTNFYAGIFLFAAALPGIFGLTRNNRLMNIAGDISYPLYLTHIGMISIVFTALPQVGRALLGLDKTISHGGFWGGSVVLAAFVPLTVFMAWLTLVFIEGPTARLMRAVIGASERFVSTRFGARDGTAINRAEAD